MQDTGVSSRSVHLCLHSTVFSKCLLRTKCDFRPWDYSSEYNEYISLFHKANILMGEKDKEKKGAQHQVL